MILAAPSTSGVILDTLPSSRSRSRRRLASCATSTTRRVRPAEFRPSPRRDIGEAATSAVAQGRVLEHRQPLAETGDQISMNFARRLDAEATRKPAAEFLLHSYTGNAE